MFEAINNLFLLVGPFLFLVQIALCIHVYRTGRPYWWMLILFMGSLIGCLLYVLLEVLPEARVASPRLGRIDWWEPRSVRIRRARQLVDETETVQNKLALAALLHDCGETAEAETIASGCVGGVFKSDPEIIAEVAEYQLAVGKIDAAERLLGQADTTANRIARQRIELLQGRVLLARGDAAAARVRFEALLPTALGEAPRFHLAQALLALGRRDEAVSLLTDITRKFRKGGKLWRQAEKEWFKAARKALGELEAAGSEEKAA